MLPLNLALAVLQQARLPSLLPALLAFVQQVLSKESLLDTTTHSTSHVRVDALILHVLQDNCHLVFLAIILGKRITMSHRNYSASIEGP